MKYQLIYFTKIGFLFFIIFIILYLGIGINIEVLSCWGFKFIPEAFNESKTAGIASGNVVIFIIRVLGFFLTICAKSCITYSSPSNVTGNDSIEPKKLYNLLIKLILNNFYIYNISKENILLDGPFYIWRCASPTNYCHFQLALSYLVLVVNRYTPPVNGWYIK